MTIQESMPPAKSGGRLRSLAVVAVSNASVSVVVGGIKRHLPAPYTRAGGTLPASSIARRTFTSGSSASPARKKKPMLSSATR